MLEVLFATKLNLSSFSFRDKKSKIKTMKKYFKEEKAQKGEVIKYQKWTPDKGFC